MPKSDEQKEDEVIAGWMIFSAFSGFLAWAMVPRVMVRAHPSAWLWLAAMVLTMLAAEAILHRRRWRDRTIDLSVGALVLCGLAGLGEWAWYGRRDAVVRGIAQNYLGFFLLTVAPLALAVRARTLAARRAAQAKPAMRGLRLSGRSRMLERRAREKQREAPPEKKPQKKR
jgi:signal transduction histidine kinase